MKGWSLSDMPGYESFNLKNCNSLAIKIFECGRLLCLRQYSFYRVIAPTSLLSEVEEEGRGQSDASQGAHEDLLDGGRELGHSAGQAGQPVSQNEPGYPTEIGNISHILTLFETPASRRQCELERLHILVENKTGTSVRRFPKILEVHIQLDQIENECLCLKLNK